MEIIPVTWNPNDKGETVELTNNNLTAYIPYSLSNYAKATHGKEKGKWYWEIKIDSYNSLSAINFGVVDSSNNYKAYNNHNGNRYPEYTQYGEPATTNDIISILLDLDNYSLEFWKNGISMGISHSDLDLLEGEVYAYLLSGTGVPPRSTTLTANFGATPFRYNIPSGYLPYNYKFQHKILLSSKNDIFYIKDGRTNLIPHMSTNEEYGWVVETSSNVLEGWRAFDSDYKTAWISAFRTVKDQWIQATSNKPINIDAIKIHRLPPEVTSAYLVNGQIKDFNIQITKDGLSWETVLEVRNETDWTMGSKSYFLEKTTETKGIRIFILSNNGSSEYVGIGEIEMIRNSNVLKKFSIQSEQSFIDHGMSPEDLSSIDFSIDFNEKHYIQDQSTPLGEGKVFEQPLDIDKIIKSVKIT